MSEKFIIEGGNRLNGEIEVRGSKNGAGPILAATLLTNEECIIDNLPKVSDVYNQLNILKELGRNVEWIGERKVRITDGKIFPDNVNLEKVSKSRMSVVLIGALLTKISKFRFPRPGGDKIGLRPISTHLRALRELGVEIEEEGDFYYFNAENIHGGEVVLTEFSVTATENLIIVASLISGTTVIKGAAMDPHVQDLVKMLNKMGARIETVYSHSFKIKGVDKLKGTSHRIIPDSNEAGTFLAMGAAMGESVLVKNMEPNHLDLFLAKLREIGVEFEKNSDSVRIGKPKRFHPTKVQALPYPGFPTDLLPLIAPLLTQAEGKSLIHDPLYDYRFNYLQELRKMGADIEIMDPHRALIFGKSPLQGLTIVSWDIRAGASLVMAALMAEGESRVENIYQIDRGYENLEERLSAIGADIKRVKD